MVQRYLQLWVFWVLAISASAQSSLSQWVDRYCLDCHDSQSSKGELDLESMLASEFGQHVYQWEQVVNKLQARQMPPLGKPRPDETGYRSILEGLIHQLDTQALRDPQPGRTETFRRLTRTEYRHAIEDLLGLEVDTVKWLPRDESSHGFDNVTVGNLSPTLLNRYISAAQRISRLAIGARSIKPGGQTYRVPADLTQETQVEGLPAGTRGGMLVRHQFTHDADYELRVRLARDRNEEIEGLNGTYALDLLIDGHLVKRFTVAPPKVRMDYESVDRDLVVRIPVEAGLHEVGVTFVDHSDALLERKRRPYAVAFNMHRHPRLSPAIYQLSINGPFGIEGAGETPSRRQLLGASQDPSISGPEAARELLASFMRRAYRRPVGEDDLLQPMHFYEQAATTLGHEAGVEAALSAVLISPSFLFKIEQDPKDLSPDTVYRLSDIELASRLSFMLWSSVPDEPLLVSAEEGRLHQPDELAKQVKRMLADPKSARLVSNFADQWLYLRNLESLTPDSRLFPDFDENLRQAMRRETELLFDSVLQENRKVQDLIRSDHGYLNERLARHYGIEGIHGSHFRKVMLTPAMHRGGLLRQGSILAVTSYATRTSPVIRGHWILDNLLGVATPPPPPDIPALEQSVVDASLPVRDRLLEHRANPACASCHDVMDPIGFSLEHYDAVGRWREREGNQPVDASGGFPDGSHFTGVEGLEEVLVNRPELFVGTLISKLLTFALGRGMEPSDAPAIRGILREAEKDDFRFHAVILSTVQSDPFLYRKTRP